MATDAHKADLERIAQAEKKQTGTERRKDHPSFPLPVPHSGPTSAEMPNRGRVWEAPWPPKQGHGDGSPPPVSSRHSAAVNQQQVLGFHLGSGGDGDAFHGAVPVRGDGRFHLHGLDGQ